MARPRSREPESLRSRFLFPVFHLLAFLNIPLWLFCASVGLA